jgi:Ca2+-binding RTX toxin-like protein
MLGLNKANRKQRKRRPHQNRRLSGESLERRELLAAAVWLDSSGNLQIESDFESDEVEVSTEKGVLSVEVNNNLEYQCNASQVDEIFFHGHAGNDVFTNNTDIPCEAHGGDGDDTLTGGTADDSLYGETGNDVLDGRAGDDYLLGGYGDDTLNGGSGGDELRGGHDNDVLSGDSGEDELHGEMGDDIVDGGDGDDLACGEDGNDTVSGGSGNDTVCGGFGRDVLFGDDNNDLLQGGEGSDVISGGFGDDQLYGGNVLFGDDFVDLLIGGPGNDVCYDADLPLATDHAFGQDVPWDMDDCEPAHSPVPDKPRNTGLESRGVRPLEPIAITCPPSLYDVQLLEELFLNPPWWDWVMSHSVVR